MKRVIDNFSTGGADYALYRPESPQEVYDFIYSHVSDFNTAWDCGTGNGQVAARLAERFTTVYATDISHDQLKHAAQQPNIRYQQERAEHTSISAGSINLTTVGQAIHWFDFDPFYTEVRRVSAPGAFFAAWTYSLLQLTSAIDDLIRYLYDDIMGAYWDPQRQLVDEGYSTIPFPFREVQAPEIWITRQYTQQQLLGYLRTWSGTRKYIQQTHKDPTDLIAGDLQKVWGPGETVEVRWPVHVRAGYVE